MLKVLLEIQGFIALLDQIIHICELKPIFDFESLAVGGVHMTLLKKTFGKTRGVINFNMWWILFLKNSACFLSFLIYRIVEFSLAKNNMNYANNVDDKQNNAGEAKTIKKENKDDGKFVKKFTGSILQADNNLIAIEKEKTENIPTLFNPELYLSNAYTSLINFLPPPLKSLEVFRKKNFRGGGGIVFCLLPKTKKNQLRLPWARD